MIQFHLLYLLQLELPKPCSEKIGILEELIIIDSLSIIIKPHSFLLLTEDSL